MDAVVRAKDDIQVYASRRDCGLQLTSERAGPQYVPKRSIAGQLGIGEGSVCY